MIPDDDPPCECGHLREEHTGSGASCLALITELERQRCCYCMCFGKERDEL